LEFENHQYYNCKITLDDGREFNVNANWLHNNQLDLWQGWACDAGRLRLSVNHKFDVYSGVCENDFLGNLFGSWQPLSSPTVCKRARCDGCTDDLLISKKKFIDPSTPT
jgi:hypothetical protein